MSGCGNSRRRCQVLPAAHDFPPPVHQAAGVITFFTPGLRFFHEGQLEGRRIKVSMHLGRRPEEPVDPELQEFYRKLLDWLKRVWTRPCPRPKPGVGAWWT